MNTDKTETKINEPMVMPEGFGNRLRKIRCSECGKRRAFWEEQRDPGCSNCKSSYRWEGKAAPKPKTPDEKRIEELKAQITKMEKEKQATTETTKPKKSEK